MRLLLGTFMFLAVGMAFSAETYKWVDEKGITNYGEKPPPDRASKPVETAPSGVMDSGGQFRQKEADPGRARPAAAPPAQATLEPPRVPAAAGVRGMDFETFIRLQRGMVEGELLLRAGRPDYESVENFRHDIVKTYYYFPTAANPYTTAVTLRGGRIFSVDRIKKF